MQGVHEQEQAAVPLMRVFLFGEVMLERRLSVAGQEPRYERVPAHAWQGRGPALLLLKVLLCRPRRRATKEEVVALIWSGAHLKNAGRACDAAASVLRNVLRTANGESLLLTGHSGKLPWYRLADQRDLWVDADASDACVDQAIQAEGRGNMQEALHLVTRAEHLLFQAEGRPLSARIRAVAEQLRRKGMD